MTRSINICEIALIFNKKCFEASQLCNLKTIILNYPKNKTLFNLINYANVKI